MRCHARVRIFFLELRTANSNDDLCRYDVPVDDVAELLRKLLLHRIADATRALAAILVDVAECGLLVSFDLLVQFMLLPVYRGTRAPFFQGAELLGGA